jgi:hypothetical protein
VITVAAVDFVLGEKRGFVNDRGLNQYKMLMIKSLFRKVCMRGVFLRVGLRG